MEKDISKKSTIKETFKLAIESHQKNNLGVAEDLYCKILKIDPNHLAALNNLGVIFQILEKNQKARDCFEKAIALNPNYVDALNNLGGMFQRLEENQKAKDCFEKAITIDPNNINAFNNLGGLFQKLEEFQKAKVYYEKAITINPNYLPAINNLGVVFQKLEEFQKAKVYYEKAITINPNYVEALNNLGVVFQKLEEFQKAKVCFEKAITINPNYVDALNNLGIMFQKLKENQKAKDCFEKVIKIDPNHLGALNNLGGVFKRLKENQKAKDCFEKIIKVDPNHAKSHNNLGALFQELGEHQKAKVYYEKAITINPNYVDALNNLGGVFQRLGENQKAKSYYERAITINPNYVDALNNLGVIFQELGEYQKAKVYYEKAITINPNYVAANNNLGSLFQMLGDYQKSEHYLKKVTKIDPSSLEAQTNFAVNEVRKLDNLDKAISSSNKTLKMHHKNSKFINQSVPLFRLKHDVEQAQYLSSKNYKIDGIDEFQKIGDEILSRKENKENKNDFNKKILLNKNEIDLLLPFYKSDHTYQTKTVSGSCINPNKNWQEVEDEYLNSSNQIMYIDNFLSDEALIELREFCLVSKVWNKEYQNKYLGAFSEVGFISPVHLQIAIDLQQKLPKLFGLHNLGKFWGFKYDTTLGGGINLHADFAIHNLNFWITPDEYNNDKNSGGLKVYDAPAPEHWSFKEYNNDNSKIYDFLKENNANCTNVPYKFNRAVLFNSAYFHETDEIDFKDLYEGRRINNTYLFGNRLVKKKN
jgi:tetratricopeptide (TPR) repeat protein